MGVLEYIINTPSHHRVHHARNPNYIDKNYAGILIIWDKLFGTFQEENEKPQFGLTSPTTSWNVISGQIGHFIYIFKNIKEQNGFFNKIAVIWKGPGWQVGTPRLGDPKNIPLINPNAKPYDPKISFWLTQYVIIHFTISVFIFFLLRLSIFNSLILQLLEQLFVFFSIISFSFIFDIKPYAISFEIFRLLTFLIVDHFILNNYIDFIFSNQPFVNTLLNFVRIIFLFSTLWLLTLTPSFDKSNSVNTNQLE